MKMLLCSDGSAQAENAVRFSALIAAACQAETSILGIAERQSDEKPLLEALLRAQEILKEHHLNAEIIAKGGRPVGEIAKRTREESYDLVVIGAVRHGACSSLCMSARAYKIIESVGPPVLVVMGERLELRRVLFCSGSTPPANSVIEFTGALARGVNAVVDIIYVAAEPPAMFANQLEYEDDAGRVLASGSKLGRTVRHQKELFERFGVFGTFHLRYGQVVPELLQEMRRTEYDLVVVGSSPASDMLRQYVVGDVSREIVESAEIPVLVMRTESTHLGERISSFVTHLFRHPKATADSAS